MRLQFYYLLFALLSLAATHTAFSQENLISAGCAHAKARSAAKITVGNPVEDDYDIKYLKFNLNMTNTSTFISGDVITYAKVISPSMLVYAFELDTELTVDSVFINGILHPVTTAGSVRII